MLSHGLITNWLDSLWLFVPTQFNNMNKAQMKAAEIMTAHQSLRFVTARGCLRRALSNFHAGNEVPVWRDLTCCPAVLKAAFAVPLLKTNDFSCHAVICSNMLSSFISLVVYELRAADDNPQRTCFRALEAECISFLRQSNRGWFPRSPCCWHSKQWVTSEFISHHLLASVSLRKISNWFKPTTDLGVEGWWEKSTTFPQPLHPLSLDCGLSSENRPSLPFVSGIALLIPIISSSIWEESDIIKESYEVNLERSTFCKQARLSLPAVLTLESSLPEKGSRLTLCPDSWNGRYLFALPEAIDCALFPSYMRY